MNIWCYKIGKTDAGPTSGFYTWAPSATLKRKSGSVDWLRSLIREHRFDVLHEPIPVSPKLPSMMFGLSVPVIIGPMNGGMDYPPNYDLAGRFERVIISILRWTSAFWNRIIPGKRHAALILVANKRTYDALPLILKISKVIEFVENGVDLDRFLDR